jgi:hypothetical protein
MSNVNSTTDDKSSIIAKIQKILSRKEETGATEAETQTALNLAQRLMAQHNLTMAEVEATKGEATEDWTEADVWTGQRSGIEETMAANICEGFFFVKAYLQCKGGEWKGRRHSNTWTRRFFGKPSNVESAAFIYAQLIDAFDRLWVEYRIANHAERSDRRPYIAGVGRGFMDKLRAERQVLETEHEARSAASASGTARGVNITSNTPGTTLATIDSHVQTAFEQRHPKMTTRHSAGVSMNGAFSAGHAAGRTLNLARPLGVGRKGLPSK